MKERELLLVLRRGCEKLEEGGLVRSVVSSVSSSDTMVGIVLVLELVRSSGKSRASRASEEESPGMGVDVVAVLGVSNGQLG